MASEVFFDTSGFFTVMDERDDLHQKAVQWLHSRRGKVRPVTTEWVVGETCSLLVARKRPHLVAKFLDYLDRSTALLLINPDYTLVREYLGEAYIQLGDVASARNQLSEIEKRCGTGCRDYTLLSQQLANFHKI